MRNCFVPGCAEKGNRKRTMFHVPKDQDLFEKWREVLPKHRQLQYNHVVCYLHFKDQEIKRFFTHIINGEICQLERGRPQLLPGAVPSLHLPTDEELKELLAVKKSGKKQQTKDTSVLSKQDKPNLINAGTESELSCATTGYMECFNNIFDDVFEVVLPNTLWGVQRCTERNTIFFSLMDTENLQFSKMLIINIKAQFHTYIYGRLLKTVTAVSDNLVPEYLTQYLKELDKMRLCKCACNNDQCELVLQTNDQNLCKICLNVDNLS